MTPQPPAELQNLVWLNGKTVAAESFHLDPLDDGLRYGFGLFETTRTFGGAPWLWPAHLERLRHAAEELGVAVALERLPASEQVAGFVASLGGGDCVVRLDVSAGVSGNAGQIWMTARALPEAVTSVALRSSPFLVSPTDPFARHKSFNYGTRQLSHALARRAGFDDALLLDTAGHILEAAHGNLFVRLDDGWITPALSGGVLAGTVRAAILRQTKQWSFREGIISPPLLEEVSEAFVTNSVRGVVPVRLIDETPLRQGEETQAIRRAIWPEEG